MNRILASHLAVALLLSAVGCDTNDRFGDKDRDKVDSAVPVKDAGDTPNVCDLSKCPKPAMGLSCCTPLAQCGMDPTGIGLGCVPNPGSAASELVCDLKECPKPTVGIPCCTPFAQCGSDPYSTGLFCFANPPVSSGPIDDAGQCDETTCPTTEGGPKACCQINGECGVDTWGIGICFAPPPDIDASLPPIYTEKPDDPRVDGQCLSMLGTYGPIWGCCSRYGVCGTWQYDDCLVPPNSLIPLPPEDGEDAGPRLPPFCYPHD